MYWNDIEFHKKYTPIHKQVKAIHCDTRDFYITYSFDDICKGIHYDDRVYDLLHSEIDSKFLIHQDFILDWLESLETMSGGKCEWRCLNFKGIDSQGWLKYIRFYRYNDDMFVVCGWLSDPIKWELCTEENLEKETLNAH